MACQGVAAQVEIESKILKRSIMFKFQVLKPWVLSTRFSIPSPCTALPGDGIVVPHATRHQRCRQRDGPEGQQLSAEQGPVPWVLVQSWAEVDDQWGLRGQGPGRDAYAPVNMRNTLSPSLRWLIIASVVPMGE
jgi:hypothetical protein